MPTLANGIRCIGAAIPALGILLCWSLPAAAQPAAADRPSTYRVGLARVCITPDEPLWLAGYGNRNRPSEGVLDDLYAKAMAVEDADGRRALLLCVDLCSLRTRHGEPGLPGDRRPHRPEEESGPDQHLAYAFRSGGRFGGRRTLHHSARRLPKANGLHREGEGAPRGFGRGGAGRSCTGRIGLWRGACDVLGKSTTPRRGRTLCGAWLRTP